jgi:hypothetical protein
MEAAGAKLKARANPILDNALLDFRHDWDRAQTDPNHPWYRKPEIKEQKEVELMMIRLEAGLPAEPEPTSRQTPAQIAQERYDARHKDQG